MLKAIIFDVDGVLVDADKVHFDCLNKALATKNIYMSWEEHLKHYKGLPTRIKLKMLSRRHALDDVAQEEIWKLKQQYSQETFANIPIDAEKVDMLEKLYHQYKLAACSNAIRDSVKKMLTTSGLISYFEFFLSNEDVVKPKPHPEIYKRAMEELKVLPEETLIIEDSDVGKESARASDAHLCAVDNPSDTTFERIQSEIDNLDKINIVIPMAGIGKRFKEVGYTFPKPLIETVDGKPMIQLIVENLALDGRYIFICQKEHYDKFALNYLLKLIAQNNQIITIDEITEGAACTVLKAKNYFDNDRELIIANSDQYVETEVDVFVKGMRALDADGGILCFDSMHPKWSYAKVVGERVVEVAEKTPISRNATVGIYYFKHGRDFIKYAERMINENRRFNNEFYVCPVYNEMIADNKFVTIASIKNNQMHGLGDPESLERFISWWELS